MIEIIGAPFDGCGKRAGSRLGPPAIRLAGLREDLESLGLEVCDAGDLESDLAASDPNGLRHFDSMLAHSVQLKRAVEAAFDRGSIPLVLGGEHTLSAASVSAAVNRFGQRLALLWIDAHADINTPGSSITGNIHGMPVAALSGLPSETPGPPDAQWNAWLECLGPSRLDIGHIAWFGLRDVDPSERSRLKGLAITMYDIDRRGLESNLNQLDKWLRSIDADRLWISFDVDVLDPILAPGTGTAVRGGLSYREAHLFAELMRERLDAQDCTYQLCGLDLVEVNPLYDNMNETARVATEWIASLFGKTILGVNR